MKRFLNYILIMLLIGANHSCQDMDETYKEFIIPNGIVYPGKATSAVVCPGKYRAKVAWLRGADPKVTKATVFWNNYTDSIDMDIPAGLDTIGCLVEPMEENTYTFIIKTYDDDGNVSIPVEVTGNVYGDRYQSGLYNRPITGEELDDDGTWTINWGTADKSNGATATEMAYTTRGGGTRKLTIPVSDLITEITDQKGGAEFQYRTIFLPDSFAIDTFYTGYTVRQIPKASPKQIDRSGWTVTASSNAANSQAPNGAPEMVIDGDLTTYWHSQHKPSSPGYPHWLAFDMKRDIEVVSVEVTPRNKYPEQSFTGFIIQGSMDGTSWVDYGTFTLEPVASKTQSYTIDGSPRMRHIRIYMNVPGTTIHAHLAEFSVTGFYAVD